MNKINVSKRNALVFIFVLNFPANKTYTIHKDYTPIFIYFNYEEYQNTLP